MSKIAFLFLVISDVYHQPTWREFFSEAPPKSFSLYVHSKEQVPEKSWFKLHEIPNTVPTEWGNLMPAHQELLREALKDKANTKFIFLSESTIPLKNFAHVYQQVFKHSLSQFDFCQEVHNYRKYGNIAIEKVYKNSQWVILNRKHSSLIVQDKDVISEMTSGGSLSFSEEHYPSTFLGLLGLHNEIVKQDCTLVIWPPGGGAHPYTFQSLTNDKYIVKLHEALNDPEMLFARKFSPTCSVYDFYKNEVSIKQETGFGSFSFVKQSLIRIKHYLESVFNYSLSHLTSLIVI